MINEPAIEGCDVILAQQTCLKQNSCTDQYQIEGYLSHFNSFGDGKGLAMYYRENFTHIRH